MECINRQTDVLIIGSGFAGAAAALRLAERGVEVVLAERGPWRDTLPVRAMGIQDPSPLPRGRHLLTSTVRNVLHHRLPGNGIPLNLRNGLLEIASFSRVNLMCASGVGGGSHVYGGLLERSPDPEYWDSFHPDLSEKLMQPGEKKLLGLLRPVKPRADHQIPNFPPGSEILNRLFVTDAANQPDMGILFPGENAGGAIRKATGFKGDSVFGSVNGSKVSVDFALLKPALEKGLQIYSSCEAREIRPHEGGYQIRLLDRRARQTIRIQANKVILAAGALNTVKLLLKNRHLLEPMPALGEGFGTNGDYPAYWRCQHRHADYSQGTPCHGRVSLDGGNADPSPVDMVLANPGIPLPASPWLNRTLLRPLWRTRQDLMILGMGPDSADGRFQFSKRRLDIRYDTGNSPVFEKIRAAFRTIEQRSGRAVYFSRKAMTVHQFGGARAGVTPDSAVVNGAGEVFNNPGLFVADSAALPKAAGGPPSVTVATWAHWVADQLHV